MTGNTTGDGYPEISAYHSAVFLKDIKNTTEYQNLKFTLEFTYKMFNITKMAGNISFKIENLL